MKANLKIYLAAWLVATALGSCNQEAVNEVTQPNKLRTVSLQTKLGHDSRIAFEEDENSLNLLWEKSDAFSVMVGTGVQQPATFMLTDGDGTNEGTFEGLLDCEDGDHLYAVWPVALEGMNADNECIWDLQGQKGTLDDAYTFMLGESVYEEGEVPSIAFRYMTAAVRMNLRLPAGVEKITQVDVQVEGAYRRATVCLDSGALMFDGDTNGGVTLNNDFAVQNNEVSVVAYFFAWDYSKLENGAVVVTDNKGAQYIGTLANGNIRPGKLYDTTVVLRSNTTGDFQEENDGTYTIYNEKGWKQFAAMVNGGETFAGKIVKLAADIDFKNEVCDPISLEKKWNMSGEVFAGTLDGQNFGFKNLKIDNSIGMFTALFAIAENATFINLKFYSGEVIGRQDARYVASLVAYGNGIHVINCHNLGCKVLQVHENNTGYAGGLVATVENTQRNPLFLACTNAAEVSSASSPSGIVYGGFMKMTNIVACVNTGKISYSGSNMNTGMWAAGISINFGGMDSNFMYGCFTDCEMLQSAASAALIGDAGSSYPNLHYSYSANTSMQLLAQIWGTPNRTLGYASYNDAVDNLNKGIDMYNWTATVPCTYKFVKGDKPTLVYAEPSTNPGAGNNNFGNGGKF